MYKEDIEAMPREIKQELVKCTCILSVDDIMSIDIKKLDNYGADVIVNALSALDLPDYWIVSDNTGMYGDNIYVVFERLLSDDEEEEFFAALPDEILEKINSFESFSDEYGIY